MKHNRDDAILLGLLLERGRAATPDLCRALDWSSERLSAALANLKGSGLLDTRCGLIGPSEAARAFDALDVI